MTTHDRRRLCPNCQTGHLRFVGKQETRDGLVEHLYECTNPACRARWAIGHPKDPQGKRSGVQSVRRLS
ncbi:MAG TPA: hypothetical protein VMT34_17820 [Aggregatilineales bacterium]|nr:hypothetical protein [Aggregatilineales bacterium]